MKNKIIVTVSGGVVQNISGIPDNIVVEIRDYDNDGPDLIDGELCSISTWEKV